MHRNAAAGLGLALTLAAAVCCGSAHSPPRSGLSLQNAVDIAVGEVVGSDSLDRTLLALGHPLDPGDSLFPQMMDDAAGYRVDRRSWLLFLDDMSSYRWAHPCRWILVDAATGEVRVIRESWWPARRDMMDTVRVWTRPAEG
ncbi:MAG: hypothetical protein R6U36_06630 [Candidatus Fermentibacteraceae bacterium]